MAWVNLLSVGALAPEAGFGGFDASQAAARSLSQTMRAEFAGSGLRVMNVYTGPVDDEWHQPLPPPKVAPRALARTVVRGLVDGLEEVACGDVAKDALARWLDDPALMERETRGGGA